MNNLLKYVGIIFVAIALAGLTSWYVTGNAEFGWYEGDQEPNFGATITTIQATDKISDSRAVINTNFANLNSGTLEVGTTSVDSITTLSNLATVGTITTGTWNADVLTEIYGGTNQSSYATGDILYSDSSNSLTVLNASSTGEVLTMDASGVPVWADTTVNEAANFTWTGTHTFQQSTTMATTTSSITGNQFSASFGGDGSDGALSVSSGTTNIDLGNAAVVEKNYTSISITGTGAIDFTNPATGGTIIILKSQGDVTITSSATPAIDLTALGGAGGSGGAGGGSGSGSHGGGGASATTAGTTGTGGSANGGTDGSDGSAFGGYWASSETITGGGGGSTNNGAGGTTPNLQSAIANYFRAYVVPGSGGGGGEGGNDPDVGGDGGRGAGALYVEVGGELNITGTIDASGSNGSDSGGNGGEGGGGGGGAIVFIYNILTADSGTYTVTGGSGAGTAGDGGAGFSAVLKNLNL